MLDWEIEADARDAYEECCKEEFINYVNELLNTIKYTEIQNDEICFY